MRSDFGQDQDTLGGYQFSRTKVFNAAWKMQDRLRSFGPNRQGSFQDILQHVVENNEEVPQEDFVQWTIPVCDWDTVGSKRANVKCDDTWDCLFRVIHMTCQEMYYSDGQAWPYKYLEISGL